MRLSTLRQVWLLLLLQLLLHFSYSSWRVDAAASNAAAAAAVLGASYGTAAIARSSKISTRLAFAATTTPISLKPRQWSRAARSCYTSPWCARRSSSLSTARDVLLMQSQQQQAHRGILSLHAQSSSESTKNTISPYLSAEFVYIDVQTNFGGGSGNDSDNIGRLVFQLTIPSLLAKHAENFIQLCRGSSNGLHPACSYVGCEFDYSLDYIEQFYFENDTVRPNGRYRWSHVLRGRGRNAIRSSSQASSSPNAPIVDAASQRQCTNAVYGGQYYGDKYEKDDFRLGRRGQADSSSESEPATLSPSSLSENDGTIGTSTSMDEYYDPNTVRLGILLTVQVAGPGYGSSRFTIVRVGESPPEWGERLLLNSGVIGRLVYGHETLQNMARPRNPQQGAAPKIVATGCL